MGNFFVGETDLWTLTTIAALACITVLARSFFFISEKDWALPHWAQKGLQYAPIAALSAVIVPEIVMTQDQLIQNLQDARLYAAAAAVAYFFWRRNSGQVVLGTIVIGMAVYLPLHVGWGW
ncbi:MAG: AzlD domain-containing protein [Rhodoferax sp.]|nr:AzlD domain-containing protein [Rhodoferax sp.]MCF8209682.1 AzlD domain-containing protein [Rhodoferax sp.]